MNTCTTCHKPLDNEQIIFTFALLGIAFCEYCSMSEQATRILAGQAERRMTDGW